MPAKRKIEVILSWGKHDFRVGAIFLQQSRGRESFSFMYSREWLSEPRRFAIDPALPLSDGIHVPGMDGRAFGFIQDSSPDRWGRELIRHRLKGRSVLLESDYLLNVDDALRMGALRYEENGRFLAPSNEVPGILALDRLRPGVRRLESGEGEGLEELLNAGSSLGGSRPKIAVRDQATGSLFVAKFPTGKDKIDVPLWEKVCFDLAARCGLNVPETSLERFGDGGSVLLSRRFDRDADKGRIPYASAMTMLGAVDGSGDTYSYLDIASFIQTEGAEPEKDLRELWKRMLFNIMTSNRDDHLRNHGFLRTEIGWRLSPVFDLESSSEKHGHRLALDDRGNADPDPRLAIAMAEYYGLDRGEALKEAKMMEKEIGRWKNVATRYRASATEIERMRKNFLESSFDRLF